MEQAALTTAQDPTNRAADNASQDGLRRRCRRNCRRRAVDNSGGRRGIKELGF
jgi:hypothetical protein